MTFVLVHGGWFGGWWYSELASELRRHGHDAYAVSLTGVGERNHLLTAATNLDTHIEDVRAVLEYERIDDAILVGHSYGGMVITGVADRAPERVAALVYSDAYVPEDGQSCFELTSEMYRRRFLEGAAADGFAVPPGPGADPRATSHPLASFLQRIRLDGRAREDIPREYIYLSGWEGTPFTEVYERLRDDPKWRTHTLPTGHNVVAEAPEEYRELLLDIAVRVKQPHGTGDGPDRPGVRTGGK
ncbi:alpha/beta fold hydrolase [Nocardia miyunensis]|uniref:alpha/beta fold hydrolase n=1 Tax=Nocardia miyunensis TaxID=282684 RepID=UPI00082E5AE8|nr:alpha/beta fold hydrolase [Nocardia miyunensis]